MLPKTKELPPLSLFQSTLKLMEKYWLTGADSKSVTFLVMATVHYSGLRGVHTEVDCVPKGWHSCQQHLQCIFTPTMSMQKEKEWRDFACIPNCWGMRTSLQPALDRKTTLRFLWGLRALQSVSEEMEISLNSKHLFKAISGLSGFWIWVCNRGTSWC